MLIFYFINYKKKYQGRFSEKNTKHHELLSQLRGELFNKTLRFNQKCIASYKFFSL